MSVLCQVAYLGGRPSAATQADSLRPHGDVRMRCGAVYERRLEKSDLRGQQQPEWAPWTRPVTAPPACDLEAEAAV